MCGALLSQEVQKPYAYAFNGGIGDRTFTGVTLDQVWVFITQKVSKHSSWSGSPVSLDRPSNSMTGTWIMGRGLIVWSCPIVILLEQRTEGVGAYGTAGGNCGKKNQEKVEKAFFDKVAEILYGPAKQESTTKGDGTHA